MTRDDIIRMAREAGIVWADHTIVGSDENLLLRFAALVAAAEREACARYIAETYGWDELDAVSLADEIRARGETK